MPIRNQIEAVVQTLTGSPAFIYGTANELNLLADDASFPAVFLYPPQNINLAPQINGSVDNTFNITLDFLFKTEFDQYTADNETYVSQALFMANQFIAKSATFRQGDGRFFKIKSGDKAKCTPVYNKFDVNTTGVSLTIALATMYFDSFQ